MSQTIYMAGAIITLADVDFKCPKCEKEHNEDDWYPQYSRSKNGVIYRKCKGCKTKLGITTDIKGDVVVWLKEDEEKQKNQPIKPLIV